MTRFLIGVLMALLLCGGLPTPAIGTQRLALVIGNAHYHHADILENAAHDATAVTAALKRQNFGMVDTVDATLPGFRAALDGFAAKVQPGDVVVIFYAGHGLMGPVSGASDDVDNYLVPIDAELTRSQDIPSRAIGLAQVLQTLDRVHAGPRIIIVDACRDNPFAADWVPGADQPVFGSGLVQPPSSRLHNVYIAFAAAPGQTASDNSSGSNGLFTQEVLKQLAVPGLTVNALFERASAAVERLSNGEQIPWFAAGGGDAASLVLFPAAAAVPVRPADTMTLDLRLTRDALACGLPVCLESAAADVRSPTIREALTGRARAMRGVPTAADSAKASGSPPAHDPAETPAATAFIRAHSATIGGWVAIADHWLSGLDGFSKDEAAALRWYRAAAQAGSGEASYAIATAYHHGLAGVPRNPVEAHRWLLRAADAAYAPAFGLLGDYSANGWGGQPKNDEDAVRWYQKGFALSDGLAMRRFADMTFYGRGGLAKDPARAQLLYKAAADAGDAEAMLRVSQFILFSNNRPGPGLHGTEDEAHRWMMKAAQLDLLQANDNVALDYHLGRGIPRDDVEALRWLLRGAQRGSDGAMYIIGMAYAEADYGLARDCHQAGRWLRRAQVAGNHYALIELGSVAKKCESYF